MCAALSGALLTLISAAITRDSSPLLFLTQCHLVFPESHWKCLCVSFLHLSLSFFHPIFHCFSLTPCFFPVFSFFCPLLTLPPSPCIPLFSILWLPPCHFCLCLSLTLSLLLSLFAQSMRTDIRGAFRQVVRHSFARSCETRDDKSTLRVSVQCKRWIGNNKCRFVHRFWNLVSFRNLD